MRACLVALVLVASLARADNTADEADVAFRLGNKAYAKRDYDKALAAYFLSNRLVFNKNVLFNIARCYEALKNFDEAYRYYNDLLTEDLAADDLHDVKAALSRLAPHVALVTVTTDPPGADVYLDREDLGSRGRSPQTLATSPGSHKVKVKLEGRHAAEADVTVYKGGSKKVALKLTPVVGGVEISGTPVGAQVRETADGPVLGTLPATLTFPPSQRLFVISAPGYNPLQLLVTVKPDETASLKATLLPLPPPTGKVVVTANRENALVRVDGKDSGFTPTVLVLPVGKHEVEVSMKELKTVTEVVDVKAEADARVTAELHYAAPKVRAASKSLTDADDAAASITVISREEIQSMGYQTLADAVQGVRGITLTNDRIYTYLNIRGFNPPGDLNTRVLILYDGHPINDIWAGQGYSGRDADVDLSEVERIEIVRGPGSALYGSGAFFAVINVVPRDTVADDRHVELIGNAGGLAGAGGHVTGSAGKEGPTALASASGYLAQGDQTTDLGQTRGLVIGNDAERVVHATMRAKAGGFTVFGEINDRVKQIPTAPYGTLVGAAGTAFHDMRGFAELRYEKDWERISFSARLYYDVSRFQGTYMYFNAASTDLFEPQHDFGGADWGGLELRLRARLFSGNQLSVGVEGQYQSVLQAPATDVTGFLALTDTRRLLLSAYLLDEWRIFKRLSITLGVRVDKYLDLSTQLVGVGPVPTAMAPMSTNATPITPRIGIVARLYDGGLTKVVAGQAFRAPNINELLTSDNYVSQKPALSLQPETITTVELEHSHDFTEELRFTVAGYLNIIDHLVVLTSENLVVPACGPPDMPQTVQCFINTNSPTRIYATGAEAELRWQANRFMFVDASYSFVKLLNATTDITAGTVTHLVSARAVIPLYENIVRLGAQVLYTSPRYLAEGQPGVGEALNINFGLSGQLTHVRYFAGVQNLLDQRAALPVPTEAGFGTIPQYGRTFWLSVALQY
jgi:outer membrane receptor for ferrienterochelin and colicins